LQILIPSNILKGFIPSDLLFNQYPSLSVYSKITTAIRTGNLSLFDKTFEKNQTIFIKWGTWLALERARILVIRQLIRNTWIILDRPSRISADILKKCISLSMNKLDVSLEYVFCLIVNLIDRGYLKGYISHEKQVLVLSNKPNKSPFPLISLK
jgi:hypothetical protein